MAGREERIAHNEAVTREINEGIERGHEGASRTETIRMLCECGNDHCDRVIAMSVAEFEEIREDPRQFAVVPEHVIDEVEFMVRETDRFTVVKKREGTPARVAEEEEDPNR